MGRQKKRGLKFNIFVMLLAVLLLAEPLSAYAGTSVTIRVSGSNIIIDGYGGEVTTSNFKTVIRSMSLDEDDCFVIMRYGSDSTTISTASRLQTYLNELGWSNDSSNPQRIKISDTNLSDSWPSSSSSGSSTLSPPSTGDNDADEEETLSDEEAAALINDTLYGASAHESNTSAYEWVLDIVAVVFEFIIDLICGFLEGIVDLLFNGTITDIILQSDVPLYSFTFDRANPYGLIAAIGFSILRAFAFVFIPITFAIALVKAILAGGTARGFEDVKNSFYDVVFKILLLVLTPYIFDIMISVRQTFMSDLYTAIFTPASNMNNIGLNEVVDKLFTADVISEITISGSSSIGSGLLATLCNIILSALLRLSFIGLTIYFMILYVILSISTALLFIALPMICIRGGNFKDKLSSWCEYAISIYVTPVIDLLLVAVPIYLNLIIQEADLQENFAGTGVAIGGQALVLVISVWFLMSLRGTLRQYAGLQDSGTDRLGASMMGGIASLAMRGLKKAWNGRNDNSSAETEAAKYDNKAAEANALGEADKEYKDAKESAVVDEMNAKYGSETDGDGSLDTDGTGGGTGRTSADTKNKVALLDAQDTDLSRQEDKIKSDYGKRISSEKALAAEEDELAEQAEAAGNTEEAAQHRENAQTHRDNAETLEQEENETLSSLGNKRNDIAKQKAALTGTADDRSARLEELDAQDAELSGKSENIKATYNTQIEQEEDAAEAEEELAMQAEAAGNTEEAATHRANAQAHRDAATSLEEERNEALSSTAAERDNIARQKAAITGGSATKRASNLSETAEMLDQAETETKQSVGALEEFDRDLAGREADVNQEMKNIDAAYAPAEAEQKRLAEQESVLAQEAKMNGADASVVAGHELEAKKHREQLATLQQEKAEKQQPLKEEAASLSAQRQVVKGAINAGNADLKDIQDSKKQVAAAQGGGSYGGGGGGMGGGSYGGSPEDISHAQTMNDIRASYGTLGDFENTQAFQNMSYEKQAEFYSQKAAEIRRGAEAEKKAGKVSSIVGGVALGALAAGYGPTASITAGVYGGDAIRNRAVGKAQAESDYRMNGQTMGQRDAEMESMLEDSGMYMGAETYESTSNRVVQSIKDTMPNSPERKAAIKTIRRMQKQYGTGGRVTYEGHTVNMDGEQVAPVGRSQATMFNYIRPQTLPTPKVPVSVVSSEASDAYTRAGEVITSKMGGYATRSAERTGVMGRLVSIRNHPSFTVDASTTPTPKPETGDSSFMNMKFGGNVPFTSFENTITSAGTEGNASLTQRLTMLGHSAGENVVERHETMWSIREALKTINSSPTLKAMSQNVNGNSRSAVYDFLSAGEGRKMMANAYDAYKSRQIRKGIDGYMSMKDFTKFVASYFPEEN